MLEPPDWIANSPHLASAYALAERAHGSQMRASDGRLFLEHVTEVATLLHLIGADQDLVAVGLLHDSVERGSLTEGELRKKMGGAIASLVLALGEDSTIEQFDRRKAGLREQVVLAGEGAMRVFAADKLSCIKGLRRGLEANADAVQERLEVDVGSMIDHYRESVELVASVDPGSPFLPALHSEIERLTAEWPPGADPPRRA